MRKVARRNPSTYSKSATRTTLLCAFALTLAACSSTATDGTPATENPAEPVETTTASPVEGAPTPGSVETTTASPIEGAPTPGSVSASFSGPVRIDGYRLYAAREERIFSLELDTNGGTRLSENGKELVIVAGENGGVFSQWDTYSTDDPETSTMWVKAEETLEEQLARLAVLEWLDELRNCVTAPGVDTGNKESYTTSCVVDGEETTAAVTLDGGNVSSIRFPDGYGPVDELRFDRTARPAKIDIPDTYIEGRDADVAVLSATVGLNALLKAEALGRNTAAILSASSNTYSYSPEEIAEALETALEEMTDCDGAECGYDQATNLFRITVTVNGIVYTCSVGLRVDETGTMDVARPRCSAAR